MLGLQARWEIRVLVPILDFRDWVILSSDVNPWSEFLLLDGKELDGPRGLFLVPSVALSHNCSSFEFTEDPL